MFRVGQKVDILDAYPDYVIPEPNSGCWLWIGPIKHTGYGRFSVRRNGGWKTTIAHRWSYEASIAPIPLGMTIDHLCRNKCCVNPDHLEVVTAVENTRRAYLSKRGISFECFDPNICINGHRQDVDGATNSSGRCVQCQRDYKSKEHVRVARRARDRKHREEILREVNAPGRVTA